MRPPKSKTPHAISADRLTLLAQPTFKLTPAEMRLVQAYRNCDDEVQDYFLGPAEDCSQKESYRRPELKGPALRLVQGRSTS
ncbi:MAG: hypothetical protein JWQ23_4624 [Herminiimonas sp.]|nr:hypothetical protein [Herminiimonas sp.]